MRRTSALALLITTDGRKALTRSDYYLLLADVLMDYAENHSSSSDAAGIAGFAHAFGNDILNIAVLAASLLWFEGVTPNMSRSPDLVRISVDVENYLLLLQSACDIMADVIRAFGIPPKKRGQAPEESFHKLHNWARDNPSKLVPGFEMVRTDLPWFDEVNGMRTKIVHRGYQCVTFTNRVSFSAGLAQPDLHFGQPREKVKLRPLLPMLKRLTLSVLDFSDMLGQAIMAQEGISPSHRHVLNGVYVPALHHLNEYETPTASPSNANVAAYLLQFGDYLSASDIGYPWEHWWVFLTTLSETLGPPVYMSRPGYVASGALVDWTLFFQHEGRCLAIIARDAGVLIKEALEAISHRIAKDNRPVDITFLVCRTALRTPLDNPPCNLSVIISDNPRDAAEAVFQHLRDRRNPIEKA